MSGLDYSKWDNFDSDDSDHDNGEPKGPSTTSSSSLSSSSSSSSFPPSSSQSSVALRGELDKWARFKGRTDDIMLNENYEVRATHTC